MEIALLIGFLIALRLVIRNTNTYKIILGFVLLIVAIPAGVFLEMGVGGCCGAPDAGFKGVGYVLMGGLIVLGLVLILLTLRSQRK